MKIWLVNLFLSRQKFHAKHIFVLSSSMKLGPDHLQGNAVLCCWILSQEVQSFIQCFGKYQLFGAFIFSTFSKTIRAELTDKSIQSLTTGSFRNQHYSDFHMVLPQTSTQLYFNHAKFLLLVFSLLTNNLFVLCQTTQPAAVTSSDVLPTNVVFRGCGCVMEIMTAEMLPMNAWTKDVVSFQ